MLGVQQTGQKRDKFSSEKKYCGVSVTKLDMKVLAVVEEWAACRGGENQLGPAL